MEIQSLAMLANMLANKFNITVKATGDLALCKYNPVTKQNEIIVPAFVADSDSNRVYARGYIDHEIGHARFTDWDVLEQHFTKGTVKDMVLEKLTNIFEDVLVERRMGECYPGCAINLAVAQHQLFVEDKKLENSAPAVEAHDSLSGNAMWSIMRYIMYHARKVTEYMDVSKYDMDAIIPGASTELEPLVRMVDDTKTSEDSAELAVNVQKVIRKLLKDEANRHKQAAEQLKQQCADSQPQGNDNQQQGNDNQPQQDTPDTGQNGGQEPSKQPDDTGSGSSGESPAEAKQDGSSQDDTSEKIRQHENAAYELQRAADTVSNGNNATVGAMVALETISEMMSAMGNELASSAAKTHRELGCSDLKRLDETERMVKPMTDTLIRMAQGCVTALSTKLQSLMQAKVLRKRRLGLYGKLDTNRLYRIATNNPRVFLSNTERSEVKTQVIILGDTSGSMKYIKDTTSIAIYAVLSALRNINGVQSAAYGFSGYGMSVMSEFNQPLYKSNLHIATPNGGTPGGSAAHNIIQRFDLNKPDVRKIMFLVTDGDFPTGERRVFKAVYKDAKAMGIDIIGIGISTDAVANLFDDDNFFTIKTIDELAPRLFAILEDKLV